LEEGSNACAEEDSIEIISRKLFTPVEPSVPFAPVTLIFASGLELLALLFPITVMSAPRTLFQVRTAIFVPFIDRV